MPGRGRGRRRQVHIHVRDPETGRPSMELDLYREVVERIRERNAELIINLTTGPGGRFVPSEDDPKLAGPGTSLLPPGAARRAHRRAAARRLLARPQHHELRRRGGHQHAAERAPHGRGDPRRRRGARDRVFDSGDIALAHDLLATARSPARSSAPSCTGVKYGFQPSPETVVYARDLLPPGALSGPPSASAAGASRWWRRPVLAGGHVRVGLEDTIYPRPRRARALQRRAGGEGARASSKPSAPASPRPRGRARSSALRAPAAAATAAA